MDFASLEGIALIRRHGRPLDTTKTSISDLGHALALP